MAVDIYRAYNGLGIFGKSSILSDNGAPGGDSSFQDASTLGSLFLRMDVPTLYIKTASANSTTDWTKLTTGSSGTVITPANVADTTHYATVAAATTAYDSANIIDGVSITNGMRVLLTDLGTGAETAYTITGTTGSWTLTEDITFAPAAGDEIYITSGTNFGGDIFTYDGTTWNLQSGSTILNELAYIRSFVGKSAVGNVMPTFSSNNFVTNGTSLETSIGAIDAGLQPFGQSPASNNITTTTTVDSVNCRAYDCILWIVKAVNHVAPSNKQTVQIFAVHDGTSTVDAANVDYNLSSVLTVGTPPSGLGYSVVLNGTGSSQTMNLQIVSTTAVDVKVVRTRL